MNANNPVCRVWRGGVRGRGSGVDKDMNFTVETASYRIAVLSKMLNNSPTMLYVRLSRFVESMKVALLYSKSIHPQTSHCCS